MKTYSILVFGFLMGAICDAFFVHLVPPINETVCCRDDHFKRLITQEEAVEIAQTMSGISYEQCITNDILFSAQMFNYDLRERKVRTGSVIYGRKYLTIANPITLNTGFTGFLFIKCDCSTEKATFVLSYNWLQSTDSVIYLPLYYFVNNIVQIDYRTTPTLIAYE